MDSVRINTLQKVNVKALFEDSQVPPVVVPLAPGNIPTWKSSDENVAAVSPAPDGMSADVLSVGVGSAIITVSGEGDPTPGQDTVVGQFGVEVIPDEATQVVFEIGQPTNK